MWIRSLVTRKRSPPEVQQRQPPDERKWDLNDSIRAATVARCDQRTNALFRIEKWARKAIAFAWIPLLDAHTLFESGWRAIFN